MSESAKKSTANADNTNAPRQSSNSPASGASGWLWLSLLIIILDQATKAVVANSLDLYERVAVLPMLEFTHQHNTGAAFSMLDHASGWQRWLFICLGLAVSGGLMMWLRTIRNNEQTLLAVGLALVLGGALGNVIDRVWLGYVIDFVHIHWDSVSFSFPAFNVADAAITVGASCLFLDAFLEGRAQSAAVATKPDQRS